MSIIETKSWLVRPEDNRYSYWNIQCHGIKPQDTENAPDFPTVWKEILKYTNEIPILVAHNASFDMTCIRQSLLLHDLVKPKIESICTLIIARKIYSFPRNSLGALCEHFKIPEGQHHRAGDDAEMCARLFLQELKDSNINDLQKLHIGKSVL